MGSLDINTFMELFENSQSTDATMLSEMLWLAKYLKSEKSYYAPKTIEEKNSIKQDDKSKPIEPKENEPTHTKEEKNPPNDKAQEILAYEEKDIPLYISRTKKRGNKITIKHKGFFEDRKNISKYLYHFKEKIVSKRNCYLDEQKTVDFTAQTDIVIPYFKPKKQKRYKLILFIDKSNSTKVWQDMLNEYKQILQNSGVFKSTEIIYFTANREDYNFFKDSKETISFNPNEITNYFKDKLIFVLTDMVNMKKEIFEAFVKLYENIPLFIMQILPPRLWRSTFLKEASIATLQSINSYPYSNRSYISEIDYMLDEIDADFVKLPIVQLGLPSLKVIGNVLKAKENNSIDGAIFNKNITFVKKENQNTLTPLEEIKRFFANASANAQLLAKSLSPIPLTMPIMKMVQEKVLNNADNIYLAEILNSKILNKIDDTFFDFKEGVRDELLKLLGREKALEIAYKNSDYIQENLGAKFGFKALLRGELNLEEIDFSKNDEIFALVSCKVLKMLNVEYAKKAGCEGKGTIPVIIPTSKRFMMGSKEYGDEQPVHEVIINYDFEIAKYPVTVGEFRAFVKDTGYKTEAEIGDGAYVWDGKDYNKKKDAYWDNPYFEQTDDHPVVCVSWNDAKAYCKWLSEKTGENYRLPTEAEWEFACRAGTATKWSFGDDVKELEKYAWYDKNSENKTHPVGEKLPNPWVLHDMHGNVWEWCEDDWVDNYKNTPTDGKPHISEKADRKVFRGGSWDDSANSARSAGRNWSNPQSRSGNVGFRLLRTLPSDLGDS